MVKQTRKSYAVASLEGSDTAPYELLMESKQELKVWDRAISMAYYNAHMQVLKYFIKLYDEFHNAIGAQRLLKQIHVAHANLIGWASR